jgi:parallel beta-helix repeat protein
MTTFYVSKSGNDSSSGTSPSNAFATLGRAVAAMGAKPTADVTYVMDGVYSLRAPVTLTARNSNDTISAYKDDEPVIRGGVNVSKWNPGANGIWTAKLSGVSDVEQFVVKGVRQAEARYPNQDPAHPIKSGWLWAKDIPGGHSATWEMAYNKGNFPAGQQPKPGEKVTVFSKLGYSSDVLTIQSVDTSAGIIKFANPASYEIAAGSRYFISGDKSLLDRPGEWSFDKSSHLLSYKAPAGFDGKDAVASGSMSLMTISNASNVTVKGLTFSDAGTDAYSAGINTAAIWLNGSNDITLADNRFVNVAKGISLQNKSHDVTVAGSKFKHIWSSAIEIAPESHSATIKDNIISDTGEVFRTRGAIQMEESWGNMISHNLIQDVPRFGIAEINWSPSHKSGGNIIQYNTILRSGQQTPDTGAIYVYSYDDPGSAGDVIRYNKVINAGGLGTTASGFMDERFMSAGIYLDNLASNFKVYGNFVKGTWFGGVLLHGGNNNDVWGNILADNTEVSIKLLPVDGRSMAGNKVHGNIATVANRANEGENTVDIDHALINPNNFYDNIYVGRPSQARVGETSWAEWRKFGGDKGSVVVTDPGFVNPEQGNYSLKPNAYAVGRGFKDLPWGKMAPVPGASGKQQDQPANSKPVADPAQKKFNFDSMLDAQPKINDPSESGTIGPGASRDKFSALDGNKLATFFQHAGFADAHSYDHPNLMTGESANYGDTDIIDVSTAAMIWPQSDVSHNQFYLI